MVTAMKPRANTSERWQAALQRAHSEDVQVRQLAGCGMWISTSASDATVAYEVTPWSCECHAGQFGDPVCKHRASLLEKLGRLSLDPEPDPAAPVMCMSCKGQGSTASTELYRSQRVDILVPCHHCHGTGHIHAV
jgi:hypothetical protein